MSSGVGAAIGEPKSEAGARTVAVPPNVSGALTRHLEAHTGSKPSAWLFPGTDGKPSHPRTLNRVWNDSRAAAGRPDLHFHDLRHSGLTWSAATGASTAELMRRAGHASPVAALRYQHATEDRDRSLQMPSVGWPTPFLRNNCGIVRRCSVQNRRSSAALMPYNFTLSRWRHGFEPRWDCQI